MDLLQELIGLWSPSRHRSWIDCQAAWMFSYVEGRRGPPSAAVAWGNTFDLTANHAYRRQIDSGALPKLPELHERYAAHWDREVSVVESVDDPGRLLDQGIDLTTEWYHRGAGAVEAMDTQVKVERTFHDPTSEVPDWKIRGIIDVVGATPRGLANVDHKATQRAYTEKDLLSSAQAVAYPLMNGVDRFELHLGHRTATSVRWRALGRTVCEAEKAGLVRQMESARRQVAVAVKTGDFLPNRGSFKCSRRWCSHWQECEKRYGGTVPA